MNRALCLVGVCGLLYANALGGAFHYDDFHSIVDNPHLRSLANAPVFFADPDMFSADPDKSMYRPLLLLTYALNYALGGYQPWGYLLVNLLLHAMVSALVALLAEGMLGSVRAGWVAGLFFAVHPLATELVNYVSSRSESLAACLYLLALAAHWGLVRGRSGAALSAYGGALLAKSVAISAPLAALGWDRLQGHALRLRVYAPYGAVALCYVAIVYYNRFIGDSLAAPVRPFAMQLWTQLKAPAYYSYLAFMPVKLNVQHQFFTSSGPAEPAVWLGLCLVMSLLYLCWCGRRSPFGWSLLWAGLVLAPTFIMPLNMLVNERRLYLPMAGLALALAWGLRRTSMPTVLVLLVVLSYAGLTAQRNAVWEDELRLWMDAEKKAPQMHAVQNNLGKALQEAGRWDEALVAYQRAVAINPRHGDAYNNAATIYHLRGKEMLAEGRNVEGVASLRLAQSEYRKALAAYPNYEEIHQNLAVACAELGEIDSAFAHYRRALELDPGRGDVWNNYGQLLYDGGHLDRAEEAFMRAVQTMPKQAEPFNNLGNIYADRGDWTQSIRHYEQALERADTQHQAVAINLVSALRNGGHYDRARAFLREQMAMGGQRALWLYHRALVERAAGRSDEAERVLAGVAVGGNVQALVLWGEVLSDLQRYGEAAERFQAALATDGRHARALFGLGVAQMRGDQTEAALGTLRAFLIHWGQDDARARQVRGWIGQLEGTP